MPAHPLKPGRKTVYLDTSTISEIADVALGTTKARPEFAPLVQWLERVAREENLVLTFAHVNELARLAPEVGDHLAEWLDRLPIVWGYMGETLEHREADHWLGVLRGSAAGADFVPFAPSMLSAFGDMSPQEAEEWLAHGPTLPNLLALARSSEKRKQWSQASLESARTLKEDAEATALAGVSEEERSAKIEEKRRIHLRTLAQEAQERAGGPASRREQDAFVERFESDPQSFRGVRAVGRITEDFSRRVRAKEDVRSKSSEREFGGTFGDGIHARLGAAYCDVFTCDEITDRALGDLRDGFGLPRQISIHRGEDAAEFVQALLASA